MPAGTQDININQYILQQLVTQSEGGGFPLIWIDCYSADTNAYVGSIEFRPGRTLPSSTIYPEYNNEFQINYHMSRYRDILDMFRHEKFIHLHIEWDDKNVINFGYITSGIGHYTGKTEQFGTALTPAFRYRSPEKPG